MSCIVYQTDRKGNKYAYESVSYWDKDKGQPRSKRKYLGRVDPETGAIIPSKKRTGGAGKDTDSTTTRDESEFSKLYEEIKRKDVQISELIREKTELENRCRKLTEMLREIGTIAGEASDV